MDNIIETDNIMLNYHTIMQEIHNYNDLNTITNLSIITLYNGLLNGDNILDASYDAYSMQQINYNEF